MRTLSERILGARAGDYVDAEVDRAYVHDGTGVLTLEAWKEMGCPGPAHPERLYILFDHIVPANNSHYRNAPEGAQGVCPVKGYPFFRYRGRCLSPAYG